MNLFKIFFSRLFNAIGRSLDGTSEKTSSVRIQAYVLLIPVLLASLVFVSIEAVNAIIAWNNQIAYVPSNESIIIFGMILSHHISVLFTRTKLKNFYEVKPNNNNEEEIEVENEEPKPVIPTQPITPVTPVTPVTQQPIAPITPQPVIPVRQPKVINSKLQPPKTGQIIEPVIENIEGGEIEGSEEVIDEEIK